MLANHSESVGKKLYRTLAHSDESTLRRWLTAALNYSPSHVLNLHHHHHPHQHISEQSSDGFAVVLLLEFLAFGFPL